jgi:hypothetical protein
VRSCFLLAAVLLLAATARAQEIVPAGPGIGWRSVATNDDRRRLRNWRDAWMEALAKVRASADAGEIGRGGALFEPDTALPDAAPPPGDYACRTVKLGAAQPGLLDYVAYPAFRCRIRTRNGRLQFTKLTGSQRPAGEFFAENGRRMIFIGTLVLGDETRALRYGRDRERNLIGVLERVGENRWRIAFPYPHHESLLDVIELVPSR